MCDGFGAYASLREAAAASGSQHCRARVRRKFFELKSSYPVEAERALQLIGDI
jgi:hypothetical protein